MKNIILVAASLFFLNSYAAEDCSQHSEEISTLILKEGYESPKLKKFSKECIEDIAGLMITLEKWKVMSTIYGYGTPVKSKKCHNLADNK